MEIHVYTFKDVYVTLTTDVTCIILKPKYDACYYVQACNACIFK